MTGVQTCALPICWFWTRRDRAAALADLRGSGGAPVQIVDGPTGRLVGTVDAGSADGEVHEGAVYVHQGQVHVVDEYDVEEGVAVVHAEDPGWSTSARSTTEVSIVSTRRTRRWGATTVHLGEVDVTSQVVSFSRRRHDGSLVGEEPLDLPSRTLRTVATWWTLPPDVVERVLERTDVPGAAHAAEHAAIGLLPLLATCDRWDLGGLSTAVHADTGTLTIFVHDGHPGGAGIAERGYEVVERWLRVTRATIDDCECRDGCPRAWSRRSAGTSTSRSTRPARCGCSTHCSTARPTPEPPLTARTRPARHAPAREPSRCRPTTAWWPRWP